jgi:spore maturation protein CgeB
MALKILVTGPDWFGDLLPYCERACRQLNLEVRSFAVNAAPWLDRASRRRAAVARVPVLGPKVAFRLERRDRRRLNREVNERLRAQVAEFRPDVLLALLSWKDPIAPDLLRQWQALYKVAWLMDDPFLDDESLLTPLPHYDRLYATDAGWATLVRLWTDRPVGVLPCGADPTAHRPLADAAPAEGVVFVGSSYGPLAAGRLRQELLRPLAGLGLRVYGDAGWRQAAGLADCYRGGPLNSEQANRVYNEAAVVVNVHHPQWRADTSLRTFAICAAGACQLVDWRPGLEDWLRPGAEVGVYRSGKELADLVRYYLDRPEERRRVAQAGCARVHREHTYAQRLMVILRETNLLSR